MNFTTPTGLPVTAGQKRALLQQIATEMLREAKRPETTRDMMKARRRVGKLKERLRAKERQGEKLAALMAAPVTEGQSVYIIGAEGRPIKIGIAKNPTGRLSELQVGCPHRLTLFNSFPAPDGYARAIEAECHAKLDQHWCSGEWFNVDWREAVALVRSTLTQKIEEIGCDQESPWA